VAEWCRRGGVAECCRGEGGIVKSNEGLDINRFVTLSA